MAQIKAHEVDRYLQKPDSNHRTILIYGPDRGLVSERAKRCASNSGVDLSDPFSNFVIDADDAAAEPTRIADEAHTVSMFGGNRLVWIKGTTQKNLIKALQPVLDLPPTDTVILVEGGDLKKSSPLRNRIEKSPSAVALPCYQDQARAIDGMIDEEIQKSGLTIAADAKTLLKSLLGDDRMASRGEVQKLCLYVADKGDIEIQDIISIVGDASALAIDTIVDSASIGDIETMEHTFKRLIARGTAVFQIVNTIQRHFQMLHHLKLQMDARGQPASAVVSGSRPPIGFQRKDKLVRAVTIWNKPALDSVLHRLAKVSLESRTNTNLAIPLTATALLAIAIEAKRYNQR